MLTVLWLAVGGMKRVRPPSTHTRSRKRVMGAGARYLHGTRPPKQQQGTHQRRVTAASNTDATSVYRLSVPLNPLMDPNAWERVLYPVAKDDHREHRRVLYPAGKDNHREQRRVRPALGSGKLAVSVPWEYKDSNAASAFFSPLSLSQLLEKTGRTRGLR